MNGSLAFLASAGDLLLVVIGFGLIIFIHELGHFLAAKWAGIRVLAFAIGFGPAALSWRKGMGWRRGSSEREYQSLLGRHAAGITTVEGTRAVAPPDLSATEYRLNWLPFGGYVKMLGQEDVNPGAVSDAPDSYQNTPIWKRMVVISAGVVCNIIAAAVLFIAVFMHGLKTEPPEVGLVAPGSPASRAMAVDAPGIEPGLRPGDEVLLINGRRAQSFNDLILATAMSRKGESMHVLVRRDGAADPVEFQMLPEMGNQSRLLEIGVAPALTGTITTPKTPAERELLRGALDRAGLSAVEPGMTLVTVGGRPVAHGAADLIEAVRHSDGRPVAVQFRAPDGKTVAGTIKPKAELQYAQVRMPSGALAPITHLLGLVPVMKVADSAGGEPPQQGLKDGDIFTRIGTVEYPSLSAGMTEIHRNKGKQIEVAVLRKGEDGARHEVRIAPPPTVKREAEGRIGFLAGDAEETNLLTVPRAEFVSESGKSVRPPAGDVVTRPGYRLVAVNERPVRDFSEIRGALRDATQDALSRREAATVSLSLEPQTASEEPAPVEHVTWRLQADEVRSLHDLGWLPDLDLSIFEPREFTLVAQGANPLARSLDAVRMGLSETNRVMLTTYVTFARLFEGTVKVEHLKGPVGIAHMGTRIASKGMTWLLFFMALISVNLAVVNFLPLPIVDGGQFIFLILEKIRGRPLSIEVQNVATVAGLILIGTMFIIVTFRDIANLFG
jgi:regulator of sigma E protease